MRHPPGLSRILEHQLIMGRPNSSPLLHPMEEGQGVEATSCIRMGHSKASNQHSRRKSDPLLLHNKFPPIHHIVELDHLFNHFGV